LLGFKTVSQNIIEMVKKAAIPLADAVRMASETPAKLIGIDSSKGTLQKGKSRRRFFCPRAKKKAPRHL
jgi:N-acetylglucosamine-6-phosphate deacetylase